jgi:transposase InsO family protein
VLTDNGVQFCDMPQHRSGPTARYRVHMFHRICREHGVEHRLTKPNHPWTNGQVERMNRTLKEATVRRYHYQTHGPLKGPPRRFPLRLQLREATQDPTRPHAERICKAWADEPDRFRYDPTHLTSGPNT